MRSHDMNHLNHLSAVATADVEHLRAKESTYQGSWKRSGGRSAWFMIRRKIDRLLEMMRRPDHPRGFNLPDLDDVIELHPEAVTLPTEVIRFMRDCHVAENIFAQIEHAPGGEDGTVLAEIRDLRRYLLLVEAEMISRGSVFLTKNFAPSAAEADADVYSRVARVTGVAREDVKKVLLTGAYSGQGEQVKFTSTGLPKDLKVPPGEFKAIDESYSGQVDFVGLMRVNPASVPPGGFPPPEDRRVPRFDDYLAPWLLQQEDIFSAQETDVDRRLLDVLYDNHGAGLVKLVPCLTEPERYELYVHTKSNASPASTLVERALQCYEPVTGEKMHVLRIREAPSEYREAWDKHYRECNSTELALLPPWIRKLYAYSDAESKWKIKSSYEAWVKEV
jgi:hypothetical protein